jgi:hypothetical protein
LESCSPPSINWNSSASICAWICCSVSTRSDSTVLDQLLDAVDGLEHPDAELLLRHQLLGRLGVVPETGLAHLVLDARELAVA